MQVRLKPLPDINTNAMSNWGSDYKNRAYWAMWGLGGNIPQDAVYGITQLVMT